MVTQQHTDLARGMLFVVDHAGKRPTDLTTRAHQMKVIEDHLARHPYYYQAVGKPGPEN